MGTHAVALLTLCCPPTVVSRTVDQSNKKGWCCSSACQCQEKQSFCSRFWHGHWSVEFSQVVSSDRSRPLINWDGKETHDCGCITRCNCVKSWHFRHVSSILFDQAGTHGNPQCDPMPSPCVFCAAEVVVGEKCATRNTSDEARGLEAFVFWFSHNAKTWHLCFISAQQCKMHCVVQVWDNIWSQCRHEKKKLNKWKTALFLLMVSNDKPCKSSSWVSQEQDFFNHMFWCDSDRCGCLGSCGACYFWVNDMTSCMTKHFWVMMLAVSRLSIADWWGSIIFVLC